MASQNVDMTSSSNYFLRYFVSLVKFSYWSKFHVNIITGSGIMTVFFYKGLTRNPEIGNTLVWVLPNIVRLGQVRDTKFGTNVFNKMLLNAEKSQGYSFYRFWVIKGKPTGVGTGGIIIPPNQISVNKSKPYVFSARYQSQYTKMEHGYKNSKSIHGIPW